MINSTKYPTVSDHGVVTHVMVPVAEFAKLTGEPASVLQPPSAAEVNAAIAILQSGETQWHDAEAVLLHLVRDGVETARRQQGITQADLAQAVGLSQPQISRIEANPDTASLSALRRIAAALARIALDRES